MAGSVQTESSVQMESGIPMVSSEYIYIRGWKSRLPMAGSVDDEW